MSCYPHQIPLTTITKDEYYNLLASADKIWDECSTLTSCCGPHEFAQDIVKDGLKYELSWGWYPENKELQYWYGIKKLFKMVGQEGDGI